MKELKDFKFSFCIFCAIAALFLIGIFNGCAHLKEKERQNSYRHGEHDAYTHTLNMIDNKTSIEFLKIFLKGEIFITAK